MRESVKVADPIDILTGRLSYVYSALILMTTSSEGRDGETQFVVNEDIVVDHLYLCEELVAEARAALKRLTAEYNLVPKAPKEDGGTTAGAAVDYEAAREAARKLNGP